MSGLFIILVAIMRICCILMIGEHAQHACSTPTPLHTITDYTKVLYCRPLHSLPTIHCTCACENRVIRHKLFNSIPGHIQKHGTVNVYFQGFFVLHVHVNVYPKAGINEDYYNIWRVVWMWLLLYYICLSYREYTELSWRQEHVEVEEYSKPSLIKSLNLHTSLRC